MDKLYFSSPKITKKILNFSLSGDNNSELLKLNIWKIKHGRNELPIRIAKAENVTIQKWIIIKKNVLPALIQGEEILKRGNLNIPENLGLLTLFTEKVRFNLVIILEWCFFFLFSYKIRHHIFSQTLVTLSVLMNLI